MSTRTSIPWTDVSWNPVVGCRRISPGCENCYAERLAATRLVKTAKYQGLAIYGERGPRWTGKYRLDEKELAAPLGWRLSPAEKAGHGRRCFVCDMGDLFYEEIPNETIAAVFGVMAARPDITFQVLTKRARRAREWFQWAADHGPSCAAPVAQALADLYSPGIKIPPLWDSKWPLPNVWMGVSVESRAYLPRIDELKQIPAVLRFASFEPLLEGMGELRAVLRRRCRGCGVPAPVPVHLHGCTTGDEGVTGLDWAIIGGESGPGARACNIGDVRNLTEQCKAAAVACFVKQLGARPTGTGDFNPDGRGTWPERFTDRKGEEMAEWPTDLQVREFPVVRT